jgi:serine/threonine-protein kinase
LDNIRPDSKETSSMQICRDQRSGTGCGTSNPDTAQKCKKCGRPLNYALQLLDPGDIINGYQIVRTIGHGGFGAVYEARNPESGPPTVALKETFNPDFITSFAGEFAVLRHLHHDNLPHYYATFVANGNGYLVMDLIPGQSLQEIQAQTADRRLRESQVLGYAVQLCGVLTYLHSQSPLILHRDIKPDNIRLTPDGLIKLVDFGLLKQGTDTTASSRRGLTMAYAPIEQYGAGHSGPTDARSDIYSLGATLYHLLTGEAPLAATQRIAESNDPLPTPQTLNPRITPHVSQAIMTAMALTRDKRFATADHFVQALFGRAPAAPIDDDTVRFVPSGQATPTVPVRPGSDQYATQGNPTKPVPTPIPESPSGGSAPPVNQPVASPQEVRQRPIFLRVVPVLLAALLLLGGGWAYLRAESPAPEQSAAAAPTVVPTPATVAQSVPGDNSPDQSAPGTLDATATALSATQTALAAGEMTAVAREAAAAQSGTAEALRQTEEALMQTAEALRDAQPAPTSAPPPTAADPPSNGGFAGGTVCDQATVVGSISQLAINPEPFITSSPIGAAPIGSRVTVLCDTTTSDERLWVRVRYAGVEGWMSTRYLAFDGQFPADVCNTGTVVGDISFLAINVETRRTSVQRGQVPVGGQVQVLCVPSINDDERTWVMVRYGGTEGWMSTRFLNIE